VNKDGYQTCSLSLSLQTLRTFALQRSSLTLSLHFAFVSVSFICSLFLFPSFSDHSSVFTTELSSHSEMCYGSDSSLWKGSPFCFNPDRD
jgi:hypothetical protein